MIGALRATLLARDARPLLRIGVVVSVLALAAYWGRAASTRTAMMLVAAGGALVLLNRPHWGLLALIPVALCVPLAVGTGTQTALNAAVLLVAALLGVWVLDMLRRRRLRLVPSPVNRPAFFLVLVTVLAFAGGQLPWNPFAATASLAAQLGGLALFVLSVGVLILVGNLLTDSGWLRVMVWLFLAFGTLAVAAQITPLAAAVSRRLLREGATGSLFWVWLAALAGGLALFDRSLRTGGRLALFGLAIAAVGVNWFRGHSWASGWLPPLVALWVLVWLRSWRLGLLITLPCAAWIGLARPDLPIDLVTAEQYSVDTRREAIRIMLEQVLPLNPVLGLGPANYYHYSVLYPLMGWYVKFNSHNQYVDILAQTGVLGMAAFLWLMAALARVGWSLRMRVDKGFAFGYVHACLAGLAGTLAASMLGDWFIPFVYNIGMTGFRASVLAWLFLGGLIAIAQITNDKSQMANTKLHTEAAGGG